MSDIYGFSERATGSNLDRIADALGLKRKLVNSPPTYN